MSLVSRITLPPESPAAEKAPPTATGAAARTAGRSAESSASNDVEASDGRSTRWDDHRTARHAELATAVRKTVHRLGPELSMDEIAAQLGTSKSILYRYFTDKGGLQNAVGETVVRAIHDELAEASRSAASPRAALEDMVGAYLAMIAHSPNVYYFVTRNAPMANSVARPMTGDVAQSAPLSSFLHSVVELVARPFVQETQARDVSNVQIGAWSAGAVGFVTGTGEWWLAHRGEPEVPDRSTIAKHITDWLWAGAGAVHTDKAIHTDGA